MIAAPIGMVGAMTPRMDRRDAGRVCGREEAGVGQRGANAPKPARMRYCGLGIRHATVRAERMMQSSDIDEGRQVSL